MGPFPEEDAKEVDDVKRVDELLKTEDDGHGIGDSSGRLVIGESDRFALSCESL